MRFDLLWLLAQSETPTTGFLDGLNTTDMLLAAGILLITISMLRFYKKKQGNQKDPKAAANETIERNRQLRGVRHDLETLMVEIEEYAKRMGAQLDAKSMRLEKLLDEADQKLQRLEASGQAPTPPLGSRAGSDSSDAAQAQTETEPALQPHPEATADPLAQTVLELADQGHDAQSIAQQLDEHVGKVELILALRQSAG